MLRKTLLQPIFINQWGAYRGIVRDPGIQNRKTALQSAEKEIDIEDIDFDELESDFMDVHLSHKEYVKELETSKERLKYQIVKQKYFKKKYPNFLTWNDKQQIKYLYSTHREEWSIDRLSESFPALPEIIEKIVSSKYSKKESTIKNHDIAVQKNWMAFRKGEMSDLPERLTEHLKKFSDRSLNYSPFEMPKKVEVVQRSNIKTEFSDIITSYENLKNKNKETEKPLIDIKENITEKNLEWLEKTKEKISKTNSKNMTLSQLRDKIQSEVIGGKEIPIDDKMILDSMKDKTNQEKIVKLQSQEVNSIVTTKYRKADGSVKKFERDYSHLRYPERIIIPKNILKYGYTYKLNDCYYDSDGYFLYRVPGMG